MSVTYFCYLRFITLLICSVVNGSRTWKINCIDASVAVTYRPRSSSSGHWSYHWGKNRLIMFFRSVDIFEITLGRNLFWWNFYDSLRYPSQTRVSFQILFSEKNWFQVWKFLLLDKLSMINEALLIKWLGLCSHVHHIKISSASFELFRRKIFGHLFGLFELHRVTPVISKMWKFSFFIVLMFKILLRIIRCYVPSIWDFQSI